MLLIVAVALLLVTLDFNVITISLPATANDLSASPLTLAVTS